MAQPIRKGAPSFCLCTFGTNNCFNTETVQKRLTFIVTKLKEIGISVLGWSADGDIRLLNSMKRLVSLKNQNEDLDIPPLFKEYFFSKICAEVSPIQDMLHVITKLRNNLIQMSYPLKIGKHIISVNFLYNLIDNFPRGEHELTQTDIDCPDRMNVGSAIKLFAPNVIELLETNYRQETKGLVLYLTIMRYVYESFSEHENIKERIKKIWLCVFILRAWRHECIHGRHLKDTVTSNVYNCVELNAHMLVNVYRKLRNDGNLNLFIPELFNSQTCESFFRCARSLTSTQSTVINFTTRQFLYKVKRIDRMIELSTKHKKSNHMDFDHEIESLSDDTIHSLIMMSKQEAEQKLADLNIEVPSQNFRIALETEKPKPVKKEELQDIEVQLNDDVNHDDLISDSSGLLEPDGPAGNF